MVKGGTLGVAHPYCPICNIDDIAVCCLLYTSDAADE